ncbi:MAG: hypothetical protein IJC33_02410 [Clostridia bacterium]|nr:hypothetical protein [Clostridia bacterium]
MNVNKPKPPKHLLEETVVELKTDFPTAVRRLQQLSGLCRKKSVTGLPLYFDSNKKGRFSVMEIGTRKNPSTAAVGVKGGLYTEDGRTKAAVFTYRISGSTAAVAVFVVTEVLLFLLMVLGWYLTLREGFVPVYAVLAFVSLGIQVAFLVYYLSRHNQSRSNAHEDADRLKEEALCRLAAIDEWDK